MSDQYHIAAEGDMKPKASRHIVYYLLVLCVLLFVTIYALIIMFRFQLDEEKEQKIGQVMTHEAMDQRALSEAYLSGKQGIFPDKNHIPVEEAMARFLSSLRKE
ncbi:MAG: hypothetical protein KC505_02270 [Myxococcales bacterium]|nr:hypothetical protein [Myxococcales bacterium]USN50235.1 MAG: hypothetical protein H6731_08175 [Myxococcales bacterium]